MCDTDSMIQYGSLGSGMIDIDPTDELNQFSGLGALMCAFSIDRLSTRWIATGVVRLPRIDALLIPRRAIDCV